VQAVAFDVPWKTLVIDEAGSWLKTTNPVAYPFLSERL
jgi:hypothetical protein